MTTSETIDLNVPFFRPSINEPEIAEVADCLRSGWLTTGPRVKQFEEQFADCVGAAVAVAVNSCTAAMHLAVEALGLRSGHAVLVPTMTFAATAEVVRYQGAVPILVDCDPQTLNMDLSDAEAKLNDLNEAPNLGGQELEVVGIMPVHVGGLMMDAAAVRAFASQHGLWVVEDAAHAFPAAYRADPECSWTRCGENTADVTCYSFYANKTITTGEGGMAVTDDEQLAHRMRQMSLHGLSQDAWKRYNGGAQWDYQIIAPGFKYNLADLAAALGLHQLKRAEAMRRSRESIANYYRHALADVGQLQLPPSPPNRIHAWHLFPIRLHLNRLTIDRNRFIELLRDRGVGCSVHWRPLHLHPYYIETFGWRASHCPVAAREWETLVSLPLFPGMTEAEQEHVVRVVRDLCRQHAQSKQTIDIVHAKPR